VRTIPRTWREGDVVLLAGASELALDGSEYQALFLGGPAGRPPQPQLPAETALVRFLTEAAPILTSAHDASEGGLAVALAESALAAGIGAEVEIGDDALEWFGEGGGRAVVTCRPEDTPRLAGVALTEIGVVTGNHLLGVPLARLKEAYS
jgi:phosphoribosylformylglycinamidine synthase